MEYCYWKSCRRALFAVTWITKNYQDLPFVTSFVKILYISEAVFEVILLGCEIKERRCVKT